MFARDVLVKRERFLISKVKIFSLVCLRERETRHETRNTRKEENSTSTNALARPHTKNKTQNLFFVLRLYDNDNNDNNDKKERERERERKCP